MNILVLNGSPPPKGNTKQMIESFRAGAESAGHQVDVVDVCRKKINGCLACEYCHTHSHEECIQKDDMQEVYSLLVEIDICSELNIIRISFSMQKSPLPMVYTAHR